jgi:hypothetical protein
MGLDRDTQPMEVSVDGLRHRCPRSFSTRWGVL